MKKLTINVFHSVTPELHKKWNCLNHKLLKPTFLNSPIWYEAYQKFYFDAKETKFLFVTIECHEELIAVFPLKLVTETFAGIKIKFLRLQGLDCQGVCDATILPINKKNDLLVEALDYLELDLNIKWDIFCMRSVLQESDIFQSARSQKKYLCHYLSHHRSYYIPVYKNSGSLNFISSRFRRRINKNRKSLVREGNLSWQLVLSPDIEDAYSAFIGVERSGWKGDLGERTGLMFDQRQREFYQWVLRQEDEFIQPSVALLKIDNEVIAANIMAKINDVLYILKMAYKDDRSEFGPGNVLLSLLLKHYADTEEVSRIDLVTGLDWMLRWRPKDKELFTCRVYGKSTTAYMVYIKDSLVMFLRKIKRWIFKVE